MRKEKAINILEKEGYYCDNLWNISDIKCKFVCTDEEAHRVLKQALSKRDTMETIWDAIDYQAKENNLKPI